MVATFKMDFLCKTSDAARAGLNSVDRPGQTGRDETPWSPAANGTEEQP